MATVLFGLALHLALILGLEFDLRLVAESSFEPDLEITLVNPEPTAEPVAADFLAQTTRAGGGDLEDTALPTTRLARDADAVEIQPGKAQVNRDVVAQRQPQNTQELTAVTPADRQAQIEPVDAPVKPPEQAVSAAQLLRSSQEIARLSAQLSQQMQQYAKRPRKTYVSAATKQYRYAAYMEGWRAKVERVGNMNYPAAARADGISGTLRLAVELQPDGSVRDIQVRRSSGKKVLDDAAVRIVRLAAPYAPFPDSIRQETDLLVITRTWVFDAGHGLSSH